MFPPPFLFCYVCRSLHCLDFYSVASRRQNKKDLHKKRLINPFHMYKSNKSKNIKFRAYLVVLFSYQRIYFNTAGNICQLIFHIAWLRL